MSAHRAADVLLWNSFVQSAAIPDVYYRPGYVRAYEAIGHGTAVAVLVETTSVRALFPLLLRPLNTLPFAAEEPGFDAASPYGYGGVLLLDKISTITPDEGRELLDALRDWCCDNQVVSARVRLHPVLKQQEWFADVVGEDFRLHKAGPTIGIDLRGWKKERARIATLHKGRRSDLSYARRHLRLTWASEGRMFGDDLNQFCALYQLRMTELEAAEYYHFPLEYYRLLAEGLGHRLDVALAWLGDKAVGAALFMFDSALAHYHLSATNDLGRRHKATTLIINAAARRARSRGCELLHLGGGYRGEDKLFAFKRSFGGDTYRYCCLLLICDPLRYAKLVERRCGAPNLSASRTYYFPEYRA